MSVADAGKWRGCAEATQIGHRVGLYTSTRCARRATRRSPLARYCQSFRRGDGEIGGGVASDSTSAWRARLYLFAQTQSAIVAGAGAEGASFTLRLPSRLAESEQSPEAMEASA